MDQYQGVEPMHSAFSHFGGLPVRFVTDFLRMTNTRVLVNCTVKISTRRSQTRGENEELVTHNLVKGRKLSENIIFCCCKRAAEGGGMVLNELRESQFPIRFLFGACSQVSRHAKTAFESKK